MKHTAELTLKDKEIRYRRLFESAQDGILLMDAGTGMIGDVNPYLMKMLGYSREEFVEKKLWEVAVFKEFEASQVAFKSLQENESIRFENVQVRTKNGQLIQVDFVSNAYLVGGEKVIQCNIRDVTERKKAQDALLKSEALLREQAIRDHLTGLFNRRYAEEALERELLRGLRKQLSIGIIMLDVDDFKHFNDTFGHAAGDHILRELSNMLVGHLRSYDIPSRYGGDEFFIILPDTSLEVTCERAGLICEIAKQFHLQFDGQMLEMVTLSVGVAAFPGNGITSAAILKAADDALYRAKREGRGRVVVAK